MSEMKDFLTALVKNPEAKKLLKGLKEPSGAEEAAAQYAAIAEKLGYNLSGEELFQALEAEERLQKANTGKAQGAVKEALDEADLNAVAGGQKLDDEICDSTAEIGEWCWFSDYCSWLITGDYAAYVPGSDSADDDDDFDPNTGKSTTLDTFEACAAAALVEKTIKDMEGQ